MRVYKIGVIGHQSNRFSDPGSLRRLCFQTALTLMDQYAPNLVWFNLTGLPGAGQTFGQACLEYGIDYQLFCPCNPSDYSSDWNDTDQSAFEQLLDQCSGLALAEKELTKDSICQASKNLVDHSDFIVAFWEGIKHGLTYETIVYATENSKLILDATDDLAMITKKDLIKDNGEEE